MTDTNTTTKPGVLAVMERAIPFLPSSYMNPNLRDDMAEARTTIERLAEKAQAMLDAPSGGAGEVNAAVELMAALAAFRGEA